MKHRINEYSRRSDGQCGLDVIVGGATLRRHVPGHHSSRLRQQVLTAEEAASKLCEMARTKYPDSELGRVVQEAAARAADVRASETNDSLTADSNVTETNQDGEARQAFAPYLAGVKHFLAKQPHTFAELAKEGGNGNMFRGKLALPSGTDTFAQVLRRIF